MNFLHDINALSIEINKKSGASQPRFLYRNSLENFKSSDEF